MPNNGILKWVYTGLLWVYTAGYFVYLSVSAVSAWPHMTWWDWSVYVSWESVYAMAWPILLGLSATGCRW